MQYRIEFVGTKTISFINESSHWIIARIYFKIMNYSFPYRETFYNLQVPKTIVWHFSIVNSLGRLFCGFFIHLANFFNNFRFLDLSQIKVSCVVLIIESEKFQASKFVRFVFFMECGGKSKPRNNKLKLNYITSTIGYVPL